MITEQIEHEAWAGALAAAGLLADADRAGRPYAWQHPGDADDDELVVVQLALGLRLAGQQQNAEVREVDLRRTSARGIKLRTQLPEAAAVLHERRAELRVLKALAAFDHGDDGLVRLGRVETRAHAVILGAITDGHDRLGPDEPVTVASRTGQ